MSTFGGRYRTERPLDGSGAGSSFMAVDEVTGRTVALRILHQVDLDAFDHEVRLAGKLRHPHLARLYHAGIEENGDAWMASEHREGRALPALLAADGPLDVSVAGLLLVDLADALSALHAAGLVHGDLVPSCAIVDDGGVRLVDLGIATPVLALELLPLPSLAYRAPEALTDRPTSASDVYALGVVFHEMLTGRVPLPAQGSPAAHLERIGALTQHAITGILPGPWRNLLHEMLALDPAERPPAADVSRRMRVLFPRSRPQRITSIEEPLDEITLELPVGQAPPELPRPPRAFVRVCSRPIPAGVTPEHLIPTSWPDAPYVVIEGARVVALTHEGREVWTAPVPEGLTGGLVADLDKDDVGELYLYGPGDIVGIGARGEARFARPNVREGLPPGPASAVVHGLGGPMPVLVVDGQYVNHEGRLVGSLGRRMQGGGSRLVEAPAPYGLALDGFAGRGHRGACDTAAAILAGAAELPRYVALLEIGSGGSSAPVNLCVFDDDGALTSRVHVGESTSGDGAPRALPEWAPIAAARADGYTVIVPWLGATGDWGPTVVAFDAATGDELWRLGPADLGSAGRHPGRALLGDLDGDGRAELVVAHGGALRLLDPHTGVEKARHPLDGVPVALGDPAGTRYAHLLVWAGDRMELLRGPRCNVGVLQWHGLRGDLWRTGTVGPAGLPIGPR